MWGSSLRLCPIAYATWPSQWKVNAYSACGAPKGMALADSPCFRAAYWLMTLLFHAFPLPQRGGFRESFRFAGETADKGYSLMVFPEGMRTPDGNLWPFRGGIGVLATNLNLPMVPMRIHGLWEAKKSRRRGFVPWGMIRVNVGEPIRLEPGIDAAAITKRLEDAVRRL